MSSSLPRPARGVAPAAPACSRYQPAPGRGCGHRAGGRSAGCRRPGSGCRDRVRGRAALFGHHLAMAVVVEAVDHHPVVAGEVAEDPRRLLAQHARRIGREDRLQRAFDQAGKLRRGAGRVPARGSARRRRAVQQGVEGGRRCPRCSAWRRGCCPAAAPAAGRSGWRRRRRAPRGGWPSTTPPNPPEQRGGIGAGLHHHQLRLPQQQQRAMRLDRGSEVDLLPLAVGEVGLAEGGRRGGGRGRRPGHPHLVPGGSRFPRPSRSGRASCRGSGGSARAARRRQCGGHGPAAARSRCNAAR